MRLFRWRLQDGGASTQVRCAMDRDTRHELEALLVRWIALAEVTRALLVPSEGIDGIPAESVRLLAVIAIEGREGGVSKAELERATGKSRHAIDRRLASLKERGLVVENRSVDDRRIRTYRVSETGRRWLRGLLTS